LLDGRATAANHTRGHQEIDTAPLWRYIDDNYQPPGGGTDYE